MANSRNQTDMRIRSRRSAYEDDSPIYATCQVEANKGTGSDEGIPALKLVAVDKAQVSERLDSALLDAHHTLKLRTPWPWA